MEPKTSERFPEARLSAALNPEEQETEARRDNRDNQLDEVRGSPAVRRRATLSRMGHPGNSGRRSLSDYDEPQCHWTPAGRTEEDCGEGVICPPCN